MSSENLTKDEEVRERLIAIRLLKVNLRLNTREIDRLNEKKEFMEELICSLVSKIVRIRERDNLHALQVNPEITTLRDEVTKLHDDIHESLLEIRDLIKKETDIHTKISKIKNEIFEYYVQN